MAPISWLTVSKVATLIGYSMEQVQELVDTKVLYGKRIGDDHLSISELSVRRYLNKHVVVTDHGVARHVRDASREGRALCGRRARWAAVAEHDDLPMCGQCVNLRNLATSSAPELATPSGDDLAGYADDEDFMSGLLAGHPDTERVVPVGGGPELDIHTEDEYRKEREK